MRNISKLILICVLLCNFDLVASAEDNSDVSVDIQTPLVQNFDLSSEQEILTLKKRLLFFTAKVAARYFTFVFDHNAFTTLNRLMVNPQVTAYSGLLQVSQGFIVLNFFTPSFSIHSDATFMLNGKNNPGSRMALFVDGFSILSTFLLQGVPLSYTVNSVDLSDESVPIASNLILSFTSSILVRTLAVGITFFQLYLVNRAL